MTNTQPRVKVSLLCWPVERHTRCLVVTKLRDGTFKCENDRKLHRTPGKHVRRSRFTSNRLQTDGCWTLLRFENEKICLENAEIRITLRKKRDLMSFGFLRIS